MTEQRRTSNREAGCSTVHDACNSGHIRVFLREERTDYRIAQILQPRCHCRLFPRVLTLQPSSRGSPMPALDKWQLRRVPEPEPSFVLKASRGSVRWIGNTAIAWDVRILADGWSARPSGPNSSRMWPYSTFDNYGYAALHAPCRVGGNASLTPVPTPRPVWSEVIVTCLDTHVFLGVSLARLPGIFGQ